MLVCGKNVLMETNVKRIRKVYLAQKKENKSLVAYLNEKNIRYEYIPMERMDRMVSSRHQGVVADIYDYEYSSLDECLNEDFVIVLDHLEDPHNLGAIIRTAEAAGIKYIIIPKDRSVRVNDTVMKTSAGALNRVKVILVANIHQTIKKLQDNHFMIYASAMDGKDFKSYDYHLKKALVIGSEGNGISDVVRKNSDAIISIPMKGSINSLNASVAAGILIFHMMEE
ncbi:MAG: 23S rRNA (guanosine(2251)-2'-O)-methyltransferase RlmB [Bacilli bacterium]|nr:23S rRNA (guanosine(2251)-2'-O)-methyltransferase RlmB [Bacilli bacterium]